MQQGSRGDEGVSPAALGQPPGRRPEYAETPYAPPATRWVSTRHSQVKQEVMCPRAMMSVHCRARWR